MLKDKLASDFKTALLAGDKLRTEVIKLLKSAILYEEVALKSRETGLNDEQVQVVLAREAKKRTESAEAYQKAGNEERAQLELAEKAIIESYLPKQLSDEELAAVVAEVAAGGQTQVGPLIGAVKAKVGANAEGARVAAAVKKHLGLG